MDGEHQEGHVLVETCLYSHWYKVKNPFGECHKITAKYIAKLLVEDYSKYAENERHRAVRRSSAGTRGFL